MALDSPRKFTNIFLFKNAMNIPSIKKQATSGKVNQFGFTLIELVIVIVIIGILTMIAIPAYTSFAQKAYRNDAKTSLLDLASREEKYYSVNNQYTNDPTKLYTASSTFPLNVQSGTTAYYQLTTPTVTAASSSSVATFTAYAAPISGTAQASDACGTFQITNTGVTSNTGGTQTTGCW
jgi:type IV pilus assembly protein PilE